MARKIFGTDGVRGLANQYPIDPETALNLGRAIAYIFRGRGGEHHRIVIGKDTRLSGYMIENALSSGICSRGGEAIFLGPLPTPGIAFITKAMRADAGVVISASHNPYFLGVRYNVRRHHQLGRLSPHFHALAHYEKSRFQGAIPFLLRSDLGVYNLGDQKI